MFAPDQIFILVLITACAGLVAWMSISSHREDAKRTRDAQTATKEHDDSAHA